MIHCQKNIKLWKALVEGRQNIGFPGTQNWTLGFHKWREISWLTYGKLAYTYELDTSLVKVNNELKFQLKKLRPIPVISRVSNLSLTRSCTLGIVRAAAASDLHGVRKITKIKDSLKEGFITQQIFLSADRSTGTLATAAYW